MMAPPTKTVHVVAPGSDDFAEEAGTPGSRTAAAEAAAVCSGVSALGLSSDDDAPHALAARAAQAAIPRPVRLTLD
jgi:hypothetical protein